MTRRVPLRRCRKCLRYDGYACHLDDLQPCHFISTPEADNERAKNRFLALVTGIGIITVILCIILMETI